MAWGNTCTSCWVFLNLRESAWYLFPTPFLCLHLMGKRVRNGLSKLTNMEKKPGQEESTPKEKEQSKKTMYVVPSTLFSAMDRYVTLPVLAKEYKISIDILLERIAQKKLAGTRLGKTWLVRRDHFEQFLELYKQEKALDSYLASIEAKRKKVDKALSALEGARKEVKVLSDKEVEARKESVLWLKSSGLYGWMIKELSKEDE